MNMFSVVCVCECGCTYIHTCAHPVCNRHFSSCNYCNYVPIWFKLVAKPSHNIFRSIADKSRTIY